MLPKSYSVLAFMLSVALRPSSSLTEPLSGELLVFLGLLASHISMVMLWTKLQGRVNFESAFAVVVPHVQSSWARLSLGNSHLHFRAAIDQHLDEVVVHDARD